MVLPDFGAYLDKLTDLERRWEFAPGQIEESYEAARRGYYAHEYRSGRRRRTPPRWYQWCKDNRHPPVVVRPKIKWADVVCFAPPGARLDAGGVAEIRHVLSGMIANEWAGPVVREQSPCNHLPTQTDAYSHDALIWCDGLYVTEAHACAAALVDLLLEHLIWPR